MNTPDLHKNIIDNLTTATVLVDGQLQLVYMNPSAEMLLEASARRLQQIPFHDWFMVDDDQNALVGALENGHPFTKREAKLVTLGGHEITIDYSVNPLPQKHGRLVLIELTPRDRLIRISREEELLSNHETVISLVRGLAHEIKNPLGGLRGAAQLLERELPDESLHDYTGVIIEEADRLRNLVDRLLGPHKMPLLEEVNIHSILEHVCSLIGAETQGAINLQRDYDPSLPEFSGDREQLIQAVLNIVRNGMQAIQEAAVESPSIKLRTRVLRNLTLGAEMHRLVCSVEIIDNGPGIPEELRQKIFYPMVSGRAAGTGLGLSIAQSVLAQHQGLIECRSEPGDTCFQLLIPLEQQK
ncbi:nitrogen regulation protein NR(II) [Amphritea balenae]|uniref:histidine kinase n=1 Tax=Amphritea balenae TaxID=452629 RepID=A0A3P1SJR6_9GAMM|nr:nitrogen regulation protein NR(II) [Amphritea balenae]RRC97531.1 nitrogen regulation protein NR(II) [Amphritea balenae]GGK74315.1 PAS domain-containing sensor histidine kinase [Amphritea balenae]